MAAALVTKHLRIAGRVQGVGYRAGLAREAQRLRLSGWVRNRLDGTVEALVQGKLPAIQELISWAGRGPSLARVDEVLINDLPGTEVNADDFKVLPTE